MSAPRMCKVFYCDLRKDRYCCRDCPKQYRCSNPCENHPGRCGLEDTTGRVKPAEVRPVHAVDLWEHNSEARSDATRGRVAMEE